MLRVPSEEFERSFCRYQKAALAQPVAITCDGREQTVIMFAEEYYRLKRRDRQVLSLEDFTQADIDALEQTRAPDASKVFDGEFAP